MIGGKVSTPGGVLLVVLVAGSGSLLAQSPSTQSQPAASDSVNISVDAISLSSAERIGLRTVRDRTETLDETALYIMLSRIAREAELSRGQLEKLPQPSHKNLLGHPEVFRGQVIRMTVQVAIVRKLVPGERIGSSKYWSKDRPVWRIEALNDSARYPGEEPLVVLSTVEPTSLRAPDKAAPNGDKLYYHPGPKLTLAGIFYKVYRAQSLGDDRVVRGWRDYPVVLAWQVAGTAPAPESTSPIPIAILFTVIAMIAIFVGLKWRLKGGPGKGYKYRSRQVSMEDEQQRNGAPSQDEDDRVDPLLTSEVEQYNRERRESDGKDRND